MAKTIIKEIIILLLLLIAIILALGIFFYDYIPSNRTVPSVEEYSMSEKIKTELADQITKEEAVLITYEITANDLKTYEKKGDYEKGKANPFSAYIATPSGGNTGTTNNGTNNTETNNTETQNEISTNVNTNKSTTFYNNTGTK